MRLSTKGLYAVMAMADLAKYGEDGAMPLSDGRHLTNYLMFLAGVLSFYFICLRFMPRSYAGMTTILFATQPLLFGHAYISSALSRL